jgi:hypothetical protein
MLRPLPATIAVATTMRDRLASGAKSKAEQQLEERKLKAKL